MIIPATIVRYADRLDSIDINWLKNKNCVLWFRGKTTSDFPIIPSGVSVTPSGTWSNPVTLNNKRNLITFNGSSDYISIQDSNALELGSNDFTICWWEYRTLS